MTSPASEPAPSAPRRTQVERRQDAERRLLEAGLELIARRGVHGMTLSEVGEHAGYSRGLVAHHFGNKDGFLRALALHIRQRFLAAQQRMPPVAPGLARLLASVDLYVSRTGHDSQAVNVMLTEAIVFGGPLLQDMRGFTASTTAFYAEQIRIGIAQGEIRADVDPDTMAVMILGMLRGAAAQVLLDPQRVSMKKLRDEVAGALRRALQA